jgi:integrase
VRGSKHVINCGKTAVLTPDDARRLIDSIDVTTLVGLRYQVLIAWMAYTFARVSAAVGMRLEDWFINGRRQWEWQCAGERISKTSANLQNCG